MLVDEFGVGASQEGTADREATEALGFLDARLLQQVQGAATGTDEHEARANGALFTGATVGDLDGPGLVRVLGQVGDLVAEVHLAAGLADVADELLGERSEIDVGAVLAPVQGDGIGEVASLGHERQTLAELGRIVDVLHTAEERVAGKCVVTSTEVLGVGLTVNEAHVRDGVDEFLGLCQDALLYRVCPELA